MSADPAELMGERGVQPSAVILDLPELTLEQKLTAFDPENRIQILGIREGGMIECFVPFDMIDNEDVPVQEEWAEELASQFRRISAEEGGTGQRQAVTVGLIDGEATLKIIDGFHRSAGLARSGQDSVYCTVKQATWDSMYDDRIFNAKDNTHVRFSRVVQWIREIWDRQPLSEKISAEQAILLYAYNLPGKKLNLEPEEVLEAREWVQKKEELWGMAAMTIHSHLKVAEHVDPRLVHAAREKTGNFLTAPTQSLLKVFSKELPNNFEMQNLVMDVAKEVVVLAPKGSRGLTTSELRAVCQMVAKCKGVDTARAILDDINWNTWKPVFNESSQRALRRAHDPRHKGAAVLDQVGLEIATITERVDLIVTRKEEITDEMRDNLRAARERLGQLVKDAGRLTFKLDDLIDGRAQVAGRLDSPRPSTPKVSAPTPKPIIPRAQERKPSAAQNAANAQPPRHITPTPPARRKGEGSSTRLDRTVLASARPIRDDHSSGFRQESLSGDISQGIVSFLKAKGPLPDISTRSHIRQAERALEEPGIAQSRAEELRDHLELVREDLGIR